EKRGKEESQVVVRAAEGSSAAHNTIVIDETSGAKDRDETFLRFSLLEGWRFDAQTKTPCPAEIQALSGKDASCIGFMYPLEGGTKLKTFCLLRSTQTCCYGPRPQYNQYVFVEMPEAVKFERLTPVLVRGKFIVDAQPDQGFIYRMEGVEARALGQDAPDIDPTQAAGKAGLAQFDFKALADFEKNKSAGISDALTSLDGKQMVVSGFVTNRTKDAPLNLLVSAEAWDGVKGTPPNFFNSVMAFPKDANQIPPIWKQKGVFTGTLKIERDKAQWKKNGIVSLRDAVAGVPGQGGEVKLVQDQGPGLTLVEEFLIAVFFCMATLGPRRAKPERLDSDEQSSL
ncbi:TPA: hypothetical protein DDW35_12095, partial [Candidatus Sumerlaeota bacterium]|nr:hypothetical protein [Candidatus Sumerlaeota bacterium]